MVAKITAKWIHSRNVRSLEYNVFGCTVTIALRTGNAVVVSPTRPGVLEIDLRASLSRPCFAVALAPTKRGTPKPPESGAGTLNGLPPVVKSEVARDLGGVPNSCNNQLEGAIDADGS